MSAPNFRAKGIKSCLFCTSLGKYLNAGSGMYYCRKHDEIDFKVCNVGEQQPSGFKCDDYMEARTEIYGDKSSDENS